MTDEDIKNLELSIGYDKAIDDVASNSDPSY